MLEQLIALSHQIASRGALWTQGPGGNVSCKIEESNGLHLWVKASGTRLESIAESKGLAKASLPGLLEGLTPLMTATDLDAAEIAYAELLKTSAIEGDDLGRPSMETGFHALLPDTFVLHFHTIVGLLMAHSWKTKQPDFIEFMNEAAPAAWVVLPPLRPGLLLSQAVLPHLDKKIIILENHGVILQCNDADFLRAWSALEERYVADWGYEGILGATSEGEPTPLRVYWPDTAVFWKRLNDSLEISTLAQAGSMFSFKPNHNDLDMEELWEATEILFRYCPQLSDLPEQISSVVAQLPTEIFRKNLHGNG